jgi:hypothetical protein
MLPLIGLAVSIVPALINLIAGDKAGTVAKDVAQAVTAVTGTTDPVAAKQKLAADPAVAAELQERLAQIAVAATQVQNEEADRKRQDELSAMQDSIANTRDARASMVAMAEAHSAVAWGSPVVSVIVTLGFFGILIVLIFRSDVIPPANTNVAQIINISVGTLGAAFATVVNYWLGSSQGSRNKDAATLQLQATQASQSTDALRAQATQTATALETLRTVAARASAPPPPPAATARMVRSAAAGTGEFDRCLAVTLSHEGGFNPEDPGGGSNFGITGLTLADWLGHPVTVEDIRNLSKSTAAEIYRSNYWNPMCCNELPDGVNLMLFDFGVNAGPRVAVKAMQEAVGVTADGSVGPLTVAAVNELPPQRLISAIAERRLQFYRTLGNNPDETSWTKRTEQVEQAAMLMAV